MGVNYYNSWMAKIVLWLNRWRGWKNAAITLGQSSFFSCVKEDVSAAWHRHEDCHKEQWLDYGWIGFLARYLWYSIRYGYGKNPLEMEARAAEDEA